MEEELEFIFESAKESMSNAIKHLEKKLLNIRAGKANPSMLGSVVVEYYGSLTPLTQVANVNTPDGRTIVVQPWEKSLLGDIEKAIMNANLGFNPMNNGENIIINVPALTEERRIDLARQAKSEAEEAKIVVRNSRKEANNEIKKEEAFSDDLKKNAEQDIQDLTNKHIDDINTIFEIKEKDLSFFNIENGIIAIKNVSSKTADYKVNKETIKDINFSLSKSFFNDYSQLYIQILDNKHKLKRNYKDLENFIGKIKSN